jgi:16S rRNA (uracil1498-N3)-methyltransferase
MHRFFVTPTLLSPDAELVLLPERVAHQVRDVLHLGVGEQLLLLDNSGDELLASISKSNRGGVEVRLVERRGGKPESLVRLTLCQGLLKSARFEWILAKGTELGVAAFAPILCRRSTAGLEEAGPAKLQRWQRILQEAAEQCGRARLPELLPIRQLAQALNDIPQGALAFMPWEEEQGLGLRDALKPAEAVTRSRPLNVALFIGPEGGLTAEEAQLAQRHGVQVVSLGTSILRAETAALVAVANTMFALEG